MASTRGRGSKPSHLAIGKENPTTRHSLQVTKHIGPYAIFMQRLRLDLHPPMFLVLHEGAN